MRFEHRFPVGAFFSGRMPFQDFIAPATLAQVGKMLAAAFDAIDGELSDLTDAGVPFIPDDAEANHNDEGKGWTAGQMIAHATATLEESLRRHRLWRGGSGPASAPASKSTGRHEPPPMPSEPERPRAAGCAPRSSPPDRTRRGWT